MLYDKHGMTQVKFEGKIAHSAKKVSLESVVLVEGVVTDRGENRTSEYATGSIEVEAENLEVLSNALPLPFDPQKPASDAITQRYRYIQIRKTSLLSNLEKRSELIPEIINTVKGFVKHEDDSDSYLRKAYTNMDLHTDGTYVKEKTDWLLMTKIEEKNAEGGESAMLHLDDWEHCEDLFNDPVGKQNFTWGSPKSKNIEYKVEHPVFSADKEGRAQISYIDQFPEPKNMEQGIFLQKLSDALEESKNKVIVKLPVGSVIIANNYFWLHGRKPFKENKDLVRELLRIRGSFFNN
jgi:hypothetical protein